MKNYWFLLLTFIALLMVSSCRKDSIEFEQAPVEEKLDAGSNIAQLMQRTAMNDGSIDNIIDMANCFTIGLPINVTANGEDVILMTVEDYNTIEMIFDASDTDEDVLNIQFPVTVFLNDYTQLQLNSQDELTALATNCNGENIDDDDIECLDFVFPIVASKFNIVTELTNKVTVNNDKELYEFIESLDDSSLVTIDFPITVIPFNGSEQTISSLIELGQFIEANKDICDEDDDFDYNDDDEEEEHELTLSEQELIDLVSSCKWLVEEINVDDQNLTNTYNSYVFSFNTDATLTAENGGDSSTGSWTLSTVNDNKIFQIAIDSLPDLSNNWQLQEINYEDDGTRLVIKSGEDEIKFKQECN